MYIYCTYPKHINNICRYVSKKNMASGNLIGCKVHGLALAYSSMDGWVCIMFSNKTFYIYIYCTYQVYMYVSRKTPGNAEGTHGLWGTIVCTTKYINVFSNRYIHIPRTSKYPEKLLKLWKLCGKLPFLWWLGGSRIYMRFCLEKNIPLEAF